mgnify:CR=1 FL=1
MLISKINPGFQSLFYWKYLSDSVLCRHCIHHLFVSILVLLEVSFRRRRHHHEETSGDEFQSLFYWKYLSDKVLRFYLSVSFNCFNPCFIGSIFQTPCCFRSSVFRICVSILVLLEVSFRPFVGMRVKKQLSCFNPCFIGSIFQTKNGNYIS